MRIVGQKMNTQKPLIYFILVGLAIFAAIVILNQSIYSKGEDPESRARELFVQASNHYRGFNKDASLDQEYEYLSSTIDSLTDILKNYPSTQIAVALSNGTMRINDKALNDLEKEFENVQLRFIKATSPFFSAYHQIMSNEKYTNKKRVELLLDAMTYIDPLTSKNHIRLAAETARDLMPEIRMHNIVRGNYYRTIVKGYASVGDIEEARASISLSGIEDNTMHRSALYAFSQIGKPEAIESYLNSVPTQQESYGWRLAALEYYRQGKLDKSKKTYQKLKNMVPRPEEIDKHFMRLTDVGALLGAFDDCYEFLAFQTKPRNKMEALFSIAAGKVIHEDIFAAQELIAEAKKIDEKGQFTDDDKIKAKLARFLAAHAKFEDALNVSDSISNYVSYLNSLEITLSRTVLKDGTDTYNLVPKYDDVLMKVHNEGTHPYMNYKLRRLARYYGALGHDQELMRVVELYKKEYLPTEISIALDANNAEFSDFRSVLEAIEFFAQFGFTKEAYNTAKLFQSHENKNLVEASLSEGLIKGGFYAEGLGREIASNNSERLIRALYLSETFLSKRDETAPNSLRVLLRGLSSS